MPLYWTIDSRARLVTAAAEGEVSLGDVMALLKAMAGANALPYRKLFDGRAGTSSMSGEDMLAICVRIRSYHEQGTMGALAVVATAGQTSPFARVLGGARCGRPAVQAVQKSKAGAALDPGAGPGVEGLSGAHGLEFGVRMARCLATPRHRARCPATRSAAEVAMGLLDILTGMKNGPRGGGPFARGGGMSPITMALLGLLAYKAVKGFNSNSNSNSNSSRPASGAPAPGGGLGDLLKGGLGGVSLGGAGLGGLAGILSGGLGDLLKQFQGAGKGDVADSWVSTGENTAIAPTDLSKVLTPDQIEFLTERTGLSREELLAGLSEQLPKAVDELTPAGRVPTADEIARAA